MKDANDLTTIVPLFPMSALVVNGFQVLRQSQLTTQIFHHLFNEAATKNNEETVASMCTDQTVGLQCTGNGCAKLR